jgi:hypothetical protein
MYKQKIMNKLPILLSMLPKKIQNIFDLVKNRFFLSKNDKNALAIAALAAKVTNFFEMVFFDLCR